MHRSRQGAEPQHSLAESLSLLGHHGGRDAVRLPIFWAARVARELARARRRHPDCYTGSRMRPSGDGLQFQVLSCPLG